MQKFELLDEIKVESVAKENQIKLAESQMNEANQKLQEAKESYQRLVFEQAQSMTSKEIRELEIKFKEAEVKAEEHKLEAKFIREDYEDYKHLSENGLSEGESSVDLDELLSKAKEHEKLSKEYEVKSKKFRSEHEKLSSKIDTKKYEADILKALEDIRKAEDELKIKKSSYENVQALMQGHSLTPEQILNKFDTEYYPAFFKEEMEPAIEEIKEAKQKYLEVCKKMEEKRGFFNSQANQVYNLLRMRREKEGGPLHFPKTIGFNEIGKRNFLENNQIIPRALLRIY